MSDGGEYPLQQSRSGERQPGEAGELRPEDETEGQQAAEAEAEAEEQMRLMQVYWNSWDQYESLNALAVDGHPAQDYNGIYLPAGECASWPQCVLCILLFSVAAL